MIAAQELLRANVMTEVYRAAPVRGNEMCAEVFICNQDGGQWSTLDVVISRGEQDVPADRQYLYRGYSLKPNQTKHPKLLLRDGDSIRIRATTARVSVVVSAEEIVTPRSLEVLESGLNALLEERQLRQEQREVAAQVPTTLRSNTRLVRYPLLLEKTINLLGNEVSRSIDLEFAERVESLLLRASSVSGTADVKAEYTSSWNDADYDSFDDNADITSSTVTDKANNIEGWNTFTMSAPLNRFIRVRITGVAANPADTIVTAYLIVREGYA